MKVRHWGFSVWFTPAATIVLIWVALFFYLSDRRSSLLDGGMTTTANLAHAFEESLSRTIREVDQTLLYVRALRMQEGNTIDLKPWIESADPSNRLATQIATTDRNGIITLSNLRPPSSRIDLSDRPHFRHFADDPQDNLYISVPVLGRVSSRWTIQFVRMLTTAAGAFDGIIVLSVSPDYLVRLYGAVDVGRHGRIAMIGLDGIIRARAGGKAAIGMVADGPFVEMARHSDSGQFTWTDPEDDVPRVGSFRRVPGQPFIVVVEMSEQELAATADRAAPGYLTVALALACVVAGLSITAARQRRQAEAAHALTKQALEHVGVGIMVVDPQGRIGMFNSRAGEMLRLPPEIAPGSPYSELVGWQRRRGELSQASQRSEPAHPVSGKLAGERDVDRIVLSDNRVIETRTEALEDGTTVRSFTDMTVAEEAQRVLTQARDAAEAAVRARAQFLAVMSHEIRTPLNGILGVNELFRATEMTDEQRGFANIIQHTGAHLLEMLTEVLDYSKIDERGVELELIPFRPADVLREVIAMLAWPAASQDLVLDWSVADGVPPEFLGDPYRVRQVLLNLISNAIKFTPSGRVDVSLGGAPFADGQWRLDFAVRDTGIGIEPHLLGGLFQEFSQTDGSITRRFGGTGLGLAICRRVVEAMGGEISVESTLGAGSVFRFNFPATIVSTENNADAKALGRRVDVAALIAQRSPVVLVAEDNQVNRLVARRMVERLGCQVKLATDGAEAVATVQSGGVDLVLMDVMMPRMDGLAATRAIRALPPPFNRIPIIGLSANAFRSDEVEGRASGMNSFVTKPIDSARLSTEIAAALDLQSFIAAETVHDDHILQNLWLDLGAEVAGEVIAAFGEDAPKMLARMRDQAEAGSAKDVAAEAHALAGTAGTLGLTSLSEAVRAIERDARLTGKIPDQGVLTTLETRLAEGIKMMGTVVSV